MRGGDGRGPVVLGRLPELGLTFDGWCPGGEQGAAYVRRVSDGHRSVLRWSPGPLAPARRVAAEVADAARAAGVPVPLDEALFEFGDGVVWIQELRPGVAGAHLTAGLLDQLLALLDVRRGLFAGRAQGMDLHLLEDGPGFCHHGPMRSAGGRAGRLVGWVEEVGRSCGAGLLLVGTDAVHFDHHPGNVLFADGVVTALIDWDGARIGNADLDLVTLRFGVRGYGVDPDVEASLASLVAALPDDVRRPAWAHMALRLVDWSLRFHPEETDRWLDLAETGLD